MQNIKKYQQNAQLSISKMHNDAVAAGGEIYAQAL